MHVDNLRSQTPLETSEIVFRALSTQKSFLKGPTKSQAQTPNKPINFNI